MKRGTDYIGVGVGALIVDAEGRIFLSQRGPLAKNERGLWEIPGGSVEFGETLAEAVRREMQEEYGVEIQVGELLDVADHILPGEGQHWVSPTFICHILAGEPRILEPGKCSAIGWFRLQEIPAALTQITQINLAHYRQRPGVFELPAPTATEFPQPAMLAKLGAVCAADLRLQAAMLYGSFALDEADRFSDLDIMLYFEDAALAQIDPAGWAAQIAPLALHYSNEFGNFGVIYENLVRAEFHFSPFSSLPALANFKGKAWFPDLERVILLDRTGSLRDHLQALSGPRPVYATAEEAQFLYHSLLNWSLFGLNVLLRGETARALEILHLLNDHLLRMARLLENQTGHWITPTRALERELSEAAYRKFQACQAQLEPFAARQAYRAAWEWGLAMSEALMERFAFKAQIELAAKIGAMVAALL